MLYLMMGVIVGSAISFVFMTYLLKIGKTAPKNKRPKQREDSMVVGAQSTSCDEEKYM